MPFIEIQRVVKEGLPFSSPIEPMLIRAEAVTAIRYISPDAFCKIEGIMPGGVVVAESAESIRHRIENGIFSL